MNIESKELWDKLEDKINSIIENLNDDPILIQKCELLKNKYSSSLANETPENVLGDVGSMVSTLSQNHYYSNRRIEKDDKSIIMDLVSDLSLFHKVLTQEYKIKLKDKLNNQDTVIQDRLPNIDNDKSTDLFKSLD